MRHAIVLVLMGSLLGSQVTRGEDPIFAPGEKPKLLQEEGAGEGPAWHPRFGLLTSGAGHIYQRNAQGKVSIFRRDAGTNGLLFNADGDLIMAEPVRRGVSRLAQDNQVTSLADRYQGKQFNQPNDLTVDSRGRVYFSDPVYGDRSHMEIEDEQGKKVEGVYHIDPDGSVTRIITHEVDRPNGLIITPDDKYLYVADNNNNVEGGARKLFRFEMDAKRGIAKLETQTLIHDWNTTRGPDGMKLDVQGRLYVAAGINQANLPFETAEKPTAGIYVFSPEGKLLEFVPIPRDEVTNCGFGGDDLKTLYVTAGGSLWSLRTTTPGYVPWKKTRQP